MLVLAEGGWHEQGMNECENVAALLRFKGFCAFAVRVGVDQGVVGVKDPLQPPAFPRQIEQVEAAVKWAEENGETYKGHTGKIVLCGGSAGGHLSVMAGIHMNAASAGRIKAAAACGGLYDLHQLIHQAVKPQEEFNLGSLKSAFNVTNAELEEYDAGTLAEPKKAAITAISELWSPQLHLAVSAPKLFLARSETEGKVIPTAQHDAMVTALTAAGLPFQSRIVSSGETGAKSHAYGYFGTVKDELAAYLLAAV